MSLTRRTRDAWKFCTLTLSEQRHRRQRRPRPPTLATNNILIADFSTS
jgi:hypothetical protein